jgi:hypothetical protein
VKNLWHHAVSQCERFRDTNLFLTYLRSFFYDDLGFVATLLDTQTAEQFSAEAICQYLQTRFDQFVRADLNADVMEYEQEVSSRGDAPGRPPLRNRFTDPHLYELGQSRMIEAVSEMASDAASGTTDEILRLLDGWTIMRRELMSVCSFRVPVSVSGGTVSVTLNDTPMREVAALPNVEEGEGEGSIDYVFSTSGSYQAFAISLEDTLVSATFGGKVDDNDRELFTKYQVNRSSIMERDRDIRQHLDNILHDGAIGIIRDSIARRVDRVVKGYFRGLALLLVPDDKLEACCEQMHELGFYRFLREDFALVRTLASISLYYSLGFPRHLVSRVLAEEGVDYDTAMASLTSCGIEHGVRLVEDRETDFVCYV